MCGIAGYLINEYKKDAIGNSEILLRGFCDILGHRGPDSFGYWNDTNVGLAHTRLAIVDPSNNSSQPMSDVSKRFHLVYNGEIYNYKELRNQLINLGYVFKSQGDTEVVLNGFAEWGCKLFNKMNGMFAIAIWDSSEKKLVIARDRFGEKPLFYTVLDGITIFASEIKAILSYKLYQKSVNHQSIFNYIKFGYNSLAQSVFNNIFRLEQGCFAVFNLSSHPIIESYLNAKSFDLEGVMDKDLLPEVLRQTLEKSVQECSDLKGQIGSFLSGGVDSSSVVAILRRKLGKNVATFSAYFNIDQYNESKYSNLVARLYGTNHFSISAGPEILFNSTLLSWYFSEPFADSSALVSYVVCKEASKHVKVMLSGDGADELFLGYNRYLSYQKKITNFDIDEISRNYEISVDNYIYFIEKFRGHELVDGLTDDFKKHANINGSISGLVSIDQSVDPLRFAANFDRITYLPNDILTKVDVTSMSNGVETRAPFLNKNIYQLIDPLTVGALMRNGCLKGLLKKSMELYLPDNILYRKKMGFGVPISFYIRTVASKVVKDIICSDRFYSRLIFKPDYIKKTFQDHVTGVKDNGGRIWIMVCLELWFRTYIDSDGLSPLIGDDNPFAVFENYSLKNFNM